MSQDPGSAARPEQEHDPYGQGQPYGQVPVYGQSYGAPVYGYPPATPYATGAWESPRTDSLAVAAFVVALSGVLLVVTFPVGLGLGIAGMVRTRRRQLAGRGFAIAAVVIGAVGTLLIVGGVLFGLLVAAHQGAFGDSGTSSGQNGSGTTAGGTLPDYQLVQGLTPGECLRGDPASWSLQDAVPVACTAPHNLEVVQVYQLSERPSTDPDVPGPGVEQARSTCEDDVLAANSALLQDHDWSDVWTPHPDQWDAGQRSAYCLWVSDSDVTGSATQGAAAQLSRL